MTDRDQTVMFPVPGEPGRPRRLVGFDDFALSDDQPADVATGLVSLGFIAAAIRRSSRFWCALALAGLLIGIGYNVKSPPAYRATSSVLLTYGPDESPASAIFDNQTMAQSRSVAQLAMNKLGAHDSLGSFAAAYTVAVVTDRVLLITASAPSSSEAVGRASAVAIEFLQFRAKQEENAQQVLIRSLSQELDPARQTVALLNDQISGLESQSSSSSSDQQAKLKKLQDQRSQAVTTLGVLEQTVAGAQAGINTLSAVTGSVVLDPAAPMPHSKLKSMITYAAYGLIVGLVVGLGIVVVRAVVSDRLRRRDDIARALGAPVRLSVGPVRLSRGFPPASRGLEAADDVEIRRITAHLRGLVPPGEQRITLAVIPVDDTDAAALALVSLAMSCASDGRKVVVADLVSGAPAATLLGSGEPGVRVVDSGQTRIMLAVPEPDGMPPSGPLGKGKEPAGHTQFTDEVASASVSADFLFTLVALDPAFGGDHLPTWASRAVAVVTAGRSSWTKVHAAGELIRLAGTPLASVVLIGADKSDETLGVARDHDSLIGIGDLA
jgi:hypothetical protein